MKKLIMFLVAFAPLLLLAPPVDPSSKTVLRSGTGISIVTNASNAFKYDFTLSSVPGTNDYWKTNAAAAQSISNHFNVQAGALAWTNTTTVSGHARLAVVYPDAAPANTVARGSVFQDALLLGTSLADAGSLTNLHFLDAKRDFGAVGNGVADDTTALQTAVTAAANQTRALFIPRGNYLLSDTIKVVGSSTIGGCYIWGEGRRRTVLTCTASNHAIEVASTMKGRSWLQDFSVDGANLAANGIVIGTNNALVGGGMQGIEVSRCTNAGILLQSAEIYSMRDVHCNSNAWGIYFGDIVGNGSYNTVDAIYDSELEWNTNGGIGVDTAQYLTIENCTFQHNYGPAFITAPNGAVGSSFGINLSRCYTENNCLSNLTLATFHFNLGDAATNSATWKFGATLTDNKISGVGSTNFSLYLDAGDYVLRDNDIENPFSGAISNANDAKVHIVGSSIKQLTTSGVTDYTPPQLFSTIGNAQVYWTYFGRTNNSQTSNLVPTFWQTMSGALVPILFEAHVATLTNTIYNSNLIAGGVVPIGSLTTATPASGNVLGYDGSNRTWTNEASFARIDGAGGTGSTNLVATPSLIVTNAAGNQASAYVQLQGMLSGGTTTTMLNVVNSTSKMSVDSAGLLTTSGAANIGGNVTVGTSVRLGSSANGMLFVGGVLGQLQITPNTPAPFTNIFFGTATGGTNWAVKLTAGANPAIVFVNNTNGATEIGTSGAFIGTNGMSSLRSNLLAPSSITVTASPFNWTNTLSPQSSVEVYVDSSLGATSISKNGTQIFGSIAGTETVGLQLNEYITLTYAATAPTARFSPFP